MSDHTDLVARLRVKINCEETLQKWDMIRDYLLKGNLGSYAREAFESWLDFADEERDEAADLIEAQAEHIADVEKGSEGLADELEKAWTEIERLKHIAEHRHPTMDDLLKQAQKTKAAEAEINELNKQIADLNNELGCVRRGEWA
jgi:DNA repair ATPase RecN